MSYKYVVGKVVEVFEKFLEKLKIIFCYLGNGVSVCVIEVGKLVNIFMGFILNVGLMMGICFGIIDVIIILYLVDELGYSLDEVMYMMFSELGVFGVLGILSDFRDIEIVVKEGNLCVLLIFCMFIG